MPDNASIADALNALVAAAHRQRAAAASTRLDVNATDLLALDLIRRHKGISPGRLARDMLLTAGGTNAVLRRLTTVDLAIRRISSSDRRDVRLEVTRQGAALMTTDVGAWDADLLGQLARLPEPAASAVMQALAEITAAADSHATALAELAADLHDPARSVPLPVAWG